MAKVLEIYKYKEYNINLFKFYIYSINKKDYSFLLILYI